MSQIRATKGQKCVSDAKQGRVYDFNAIFCKTRRGFGLQKAVIKETSNASK